MNGGRIVRTIMLDAVFGFGALGAVMLTAASAWKVGSDLRFFLLVTAAAFLAAGWVRGSGAAGSSWSRGLVVAAGGALPVVVLAATGNAFTKVLWPVGFAFASLLGGIGGVRSRKLWASGRRSTGTLLALVALACVAGAAFTAVPVLVASTYTERVNRVVPAFSISTLDGTVEGSSELKGRVTVLAFWATWCVPCLAEYPALQEIHASYKENSQVTFVAVNSGGESDTVEEVRAFLGRRGWTVPVALDPGKSTMAALGLSGLPTLIVLDKSGRLRMIHSGYDASEDLRSSVRRVVNELLAEHG
jgi:thiol-disulfide isomerase/thioredoxin